MGNKFRNTYWAASLVLLALKGVGDLKSHGTHGVHSQRCACLSQCYACMWSAATARPEPQDD